MFLEKDPKRLYSDGVPELEDKSTDQAEKPVGKSASGKFEEQRGDPRLIHHVPFKRAAYESFSEVLFCVPKKSGLQPKRVKRRRDEAEIRSEDVEYFCETVLTQNERTRRGYWEIRPESWRPDEEPIPVFEFKSFSFFAQCEEKKVVKISAKDVAAMLGPCMDASGDVLQKITSTWISHTESDKASIKWELRGPKKVETDHPGGNLLKERAKSFFKART